VTDVVLDTSVAVRVLLSPDEGDAALWQRLRDGTCHAPHLIDAETGSALRRLTAQGAILDDTAESALYALGNLVDERYPHRNLAPAAWALRHNLTYYDALYVALAARLGFPLLTADARLANAPGLPCAVELVD
jgi:predicted nucleic acid-binding protein